jgi:hypothetical protein
LSVIVTRRMWHGHSQYGTFNASARATVPQWWQVRQRPSGILPYGPST